MRTNAKMNEPTHSATNWNNLLVASYQRPATGFQMPNRKCKTYKLRMGEFRWAEKQRKKRKETNAIPARYSKHRNKYSFLKIQNIRCRDALNAIQMQMQIQIQSGWINKIYSRIVYSLEVFCCWYKSFHLLPILFFDFRPGDAVFRLIIHPTFHLHFN